MHADVHEGRILNHFRFWFLSGPVCRSSQFPLLSISARARALLCVCVAGFDTNGPVGQLLT